jgi:hypothetical protein
MFESSFNARLNEALVGICEAQPWEVCKNTQIQTSFKHRQIHSLLSNFFDRISETIHFFQSRQNSYSKIWHRLADSHRYVS